VAAASIALAVVGLSQVAPAPIPDISVILRCSANPDHVEMKMHNGGDADTAVLLGYVHADGGSYAPRNLVVEIRRPETRESEILQYLPADTSNPRAINLGRLSPQSCVPKLT
jgi:hypothetical protein